MGRLVRIVAVSAVVGLTACTAAPEAGAPSAQETPSAAVERADLAPLDSFLWLHEDNGPAAIQERHLRGELLVAECMAEQGFEYLPQPISVQELAPGEPEHGSREFAERYGYGMFRQPQYVTATEGVDPVDANADIKAAMSLAERTEYDRALHGTGEGGYFESGDEVDLDTTGCWGMSLDHDLNGGGKDDPVFLDASAYAHHIDEVLLEADPRVVAADAQWSACMADAGWPGLTSQPEAASLAIDWSRALVDPETSVMARPGDQLLDDEISLALADVDCATETGLLPLRDEVRAELQQAYVDQHRDELEAWRQTWGS